MEQTMTTKTITIHATFFHNGLDVGKDLMSGMKPKFRLPTMSPSFFFLTAQVDAATPIPHGKVGDIVAVIIGPAELIDSIAVDTELEVFGLPYEKIGAATVKVIA